MKEVEKTLSLFYEVGRIIRCSLGKALPISIGQFELLRFVGEMRNPTMRNIASHFKIAAPSVTSLVDELVRTKYLARVANTRDRREVRVSLTKKGGQMLASITGRRKKIIRKLLSPLTARDRRDLDRILNTIIVNF